MRRMILMAALIANVPVAMEAQQRAARTGSTASSAVAVYNASATMRVSGALEIAAEREITGDVAVLNGPIVISGRITGSLVAINADVRLVSGARIGENLLVIGGTVERADGVTIGGEVRVQAELLRYSMEGERLVPEDSRGTD